WVMDQQQQAAVELRYEEADRQEYRAYLMYSRAHQLVMSLMRERDPDIDTRVQGDPDELRAYLLEEYDVPEDDIEIVFWCALTWGSAISNAPSPDALIDLPAVRALAEHVVELNEGYEDAGALTLLAGFEASYPRQFGGNWEKARQQ